MTFQTLPATSKPLRKDNWSTIQLDSREIVDGELATADKFNDPIQSSCAAGNFQRCSRRFAGVVPIVVHV